MTDLETAALRLATTAHSGQEDKQGRDYLRNHLIPVAALLRPFGSHAYVAGLLHDILEDTPVTEDDLAAGGLPLVVIRAVVSVTRRSGEPYDDLIRRAAADPLGRLVKLADNWVNLSGNDDLAAIDPARAATLRTRYERARLTLEQSFTTAEH